MDNQLKQAMASVRASESLKAGVRQRLQAERRRRQPIVFRQIAVTAAVCCLLCIALVGGGAAAYAAPISYVTVETGPSVELGINLFSRVVSQTGLNDTGTAVCVQNNVKTMPYEQAVMTLLEDPAMVAVQETPTVTVVAGDGRQQQMVDTLTAACPQADCTGTGQETRAQAQDYDLPVGKYRLLEQLWALGDTLTAEQCRSMTMNALRERLAAYNQPASTQTTTVGNGNGNGGGNGNGSGAGGGQYGKK